MNRIVGLALMIILSNGFYAFGQYEWDIHFSEIDTNEIASQLLIDEEGNAYAHVMKDSVTWPNFYHSEIYKINPNGEIIKNWKPVKADTVVTIDEMIMSKDGNLIVAAHGVSDYVSPSNKTLNTCLFSLNSNLELNWEHIYQYEQDSTNKSTKYLLELIDGNFILAGTSYYPYWWEENMEMYILTFSSMGDSLDFIYFPNNISKPMWDFTYNMDSTRYWIHMSNPDGTGSGIIKELNLDYDSITIRNYQIGHGTSKNIILFNNNSILYSSDDLYQNAEEPQILAIMYDNNMNIVNECVMTDGDKRAYAARKKSLDYIDTNRIFVGGTYDYPIAYQNHWLYIAVLNSQLKLMEEKYFEGDHYDDMFSIGVAPDSGLIICGLRMQYQEDVIHHDAWIFKLNKDFIMGTSPLINSDWHHAMIYPNPGQDKILIRTTLKNSTIYFYSTEGQLIHQQSIDQHITEIDASSYKSGTYFYKIMKGAIILESGTWIKN